jgi:nicotinate (nicotinamide) nucleotide adenylyltransferase
MKIGFLMGSFDPIHIGHINMVREALNLVDKVILVPSGHNPWKKDIEPAPLYLRVDMISKSIIPFGDRVEVSNIEGKFEPPYYANKPLNYFRETYKDDELYIICGTDTIDKIPYWKDAVTDILPFYKLICMERDSSGLHKSNGFATRYTEDKNGNKYEYIHYFIMPLSISSTYVRMLSKENKPLYPLVPLEVEKIINYNKLYK